MIDKTMVGARIQSLRRKLGVSQAELAGKLGVTAQAVSKWETGAALPDLDILLSLSKLTGQSINQILEGQDVLALLANRPFEQDDIAYFVPHEERAYNAMWARDIVNCGWTERNWAAWQKDKGARDWIGKRICDHGGTVLELAVGPGGGYMPILYKHNPDITLIVSDLSPTVVREWKRVLEREARPPNFHYAALDNCDLPFHDQSIDVISTGGGFGNTEGDKVRALSEIYRVLKPGGLYVSGDGFVTQDTLHALPQEAQATLLARMPDIFEDYHEQTVAVGFKTIDNVITDGWMTSGDESTVADLARELGIDLHFTGYVRFCTK